MTILIVSGISFIFTVRSNFFFNFTFYVGIPITADTSLPKRVVTSTCLFEACTCDSLSDALQFHTLMMQRVVLCHVHRVTTWQLSAWYSSALIRWGYRRLVYYQFQLNKAQAFHLFITRRVLGFHINWALIFVSLLCFFIEPAISVWEYMDLFNKISRKGGKLILSVWIGSLYLLSILKLALVKIVSWEKLYHPITFYEFRDLCICIYYIQNMNYVWHEHELRTWYSNPYSGVVNEHWIYFNKITLNSMKMLDVEEEGKIVPT